MVYTKRNPLRVAGSAALSAVLAVGIMMPVAMPTEAYADPTSAEKQAEAQSVLASLNAMQAELDQASNNYYTALDEQEQAQQKMDEAQQRIDVLAEKLSAEKAGPVCPQCGHSCGTEDAFCPACGTQLPRKG